MDSRGKPGHTTTTAKKPTTTAVTATTTSTIQNEPCERTKPQLGRQKIRWALQKQLLRRKQHPYCHHNIHTAITTIDSNTITITTVVTIAAAEEASTTFDVFQ